MFGNDGRLCQHSRPHDRVKPIRKHPTATGYVEKLYELKGLEPERANIAETEFFSPVDNAAADALILMESAGNQARWDSRRRGGWAVFLHSLLLRSPEDVAAFKENWLHFMSSDALSRWESTYQDVRKSSDPATFKDDMAKQSIENYERSAMITMIHTLNRGRVAQHIQNMLWHIVDTSDADFDFLTSDRPVIRTNGLLIEGGHLALPIGPRKLFLAARDLAALEPILKMSMRQLVREVNRQVCSYAVKYVWGIDDSQLPFVEKHLATKDQPRLAQLSDKQRQEISEGIGRRRDQ